MCSSFSLYVCIRGQCVERDNCDCTTNFYGDNCEYATCNGLPANESCSVHGYCFQNDLCTCLTGFYGPTCMYEIPFSATLTILSGSLSFGIAGSVNTFTIISKNVNNKTRSGNRTSFSTEPRDVFLVTHTSSIVQLVHGQNYFVGIIPDFKGSFICLDDVIIIFIKFNLENVGVYVVNYLIEIAGEYTLDLKFMNTSGNSTETVYSTNVQISANSLSSSQSKLYLPDTHVYAGKDVKINIMALDAYDNFRIGYNDIANFKLSINGEHESFNEIPISAVIDDMSKKTVIRDNGGFLLGGFTGNYTARISIGKTGEYVILLTALVNNGGNYSWEKVWEENLLIRSRKNS